MAIQLTYRFDKRKRKAFEKPSSIFKHLKSRNAFVSRLIGIRNRTVYIPDNYLKAHPRRGTFRLAGSLPHRRDMWSRQPLWSSHGVWVMLDVRIGMKHGEDRAVIREGKPVNSAPRDIADFNWTGSMSQFMNENDAKDYLFARYGIII